MKWFPDLVYDDARADVCLVDISLPDSPAPCPVFIYFHGGGIENGSRKCTADDLNRALAEKGVALASVDYRMYPGARFPEFVEDAAKAIAFVKKYGEDNGLFSKIYVCGSSAGAYLAMMTYFDGSYLGQYNIAPNSLDGWIFNAGQPTVHFNVLRERGLDTRLVRLDEASPLFFIDRDFSAPRQSRLMIVVAENDIPGRLEQNKLLLKTMEEFKYDMSKVTYRFMEGCAHCSYPLIDLLTEFIGC